ncbi:extracellular solute-binding protein [Paenibacillus abyssi]|uniref:Lipoprotein LipO n=1 Tax=Paenibacillus abyssi TaxID=1340531 RepID=A0A917CX10_9BACL|nr:extracellular solute-binding protein [Paenibacillus abyssi]GGG00430.1 lipoprotein LipO [Paenibacillus abyssi]
MKKKFSILFVFVMALTLLAACGSNNNNAPANEPAPAAPNNGANEGASGNDNGEPAVIKVFMSGGAKFPDGQDINNNPWTEMLEEENNVDLQIEYGPAAPDEFMNKLTLKFASNDIPDLFVIPGSSQGWLMQNAELGALMELDGKVDNFENLKNAVYPNAWEAAKYNGKMYAIPVLNDGNKGTSNLYIRQDWLDKLNLDVPATLDEYVNVAKAFRDQDPDGNGKNDTYGMIAYDSMLGWSHLFGAFGVIPGYWIEKDGALVQSDVQPEMKEALAFISNLYKEKLLDNEWPITKVAAFHEKVANNQAGVYEGSWAAPRNEINTSKQNDPNAQWVKIAPPKGPNGDSGVFGGAEYKTFAVISSQAQNVDAILGMLDWMALPENIDKFVFGFGELGEGFMYDMVDGKYALNFENHNLYGYRQQLMFMQPKELNTKKMESLGADFDLVGSINHSTEYVIPSQYVGAPTPAMVEHLSTLDKLRAETFTKIIVGELPVDAFDDFVEEYNSKGGEAIAAEVQEWHAGR